jgi:hypothetical protein
MPTAKAAEMTFPWPYKKLRSSKIAELAYWTYYNEGGCCVGVYKAIVKSVAEKLGDPYTSFPFDFSQFGAGGIALWGSICGTLNGAAMAIAMFHKSSTGFPLINELYTWYERAKLPDFKPKNPKLTLAAAKFPQSVADSVLCHTSISRWVAKSGLEAFSAERKERCARMAAAVAKYTVDLLNAARKGKFVPKKQISKDAEKCLVCHKTPGEQIENEPDVLSKMNCVPCHDAETDKTKLHF